MKYKRFIRFVVNDNGNGKLKAMNKIIKIYDDENKFIEIKSPHIYAVGTQIDVDIEETDSNKYLPLRYFKYKDGKIVKKTNAEIEKVDKEYQERKKEILKSIEQKKEQIEDAKNIIIDKNKTDKQRLNAVSDLVKLGVMK